MELESLNALSEQEIEENHVDIYNSLIPLLRTKSEDLDAYLKIVAFDIPLENTNAKAHCHFITLDGNKRPRAKDLAKYLGHHVTNFAIPRSERLQAIKRSISTGSSQYTDELNQKARSLFTRLPTSGEGGEVLLSLLAETYLELPQLFTKMVLKTNSEMHVHGSDGIHVGTKQDKGGLAIYWGESKLYSDVAEATRQCFSSIAPFLLDDGGGGASQDRDIQLMRDGIDLDNKSLEEAIKCFLDPNNPNFNEMEYRGLCLIGFDSEAYPSEPNSKDVEKLKADIVTVFEGRKSHLSKRISEEKIDSFHIEVFCLPFPSVDEFRKSFREELGFSDG